MRCKQSHATKNDQHVESQPPIPVYEDIHTTSCDKPTIELSENVAYGQTKVHNLMYWLMPVFAFYAVVYTCSNRLVLVSMYDVTVLILNYIVHAVECVTIIHT